MSDCDAALSIPPSSIFSSGFSYPTHASGELIILRHCKYVITLSSPAVHWFRLGRKYINKIMCSGYKILVQRPCFCSGFAPPGALGKERGRGQSILGILYIYIYFVK